MILFLEAVTFWPSMVRAAVVPAPGTESNAGSKMDAWLVKRGLIGGGMIGQQSGGDTMMPPPGAEVNETRQTENSTGEIVTHVKSWNETVEDNTIHIEITTLSTTQFEVAFGCFPIIVRVARCISGRSMIAGALCRAHSGAMMRPCCEWLARRICHMTYTRIPYRGRRFYGCLARRSKAPKACLISKSHPQLRRSGGRRRGL